MMNFVPTRHGICNDRALTERIAAKLKGERITVSPARPRLCSSGHRRVASGSFLPVAPHGPGR
jgi:hypothetical protein